MFQEMMPLNQGGSEGSDIGKAEFAFYGASSANTLVKVGAYNFATNTAKCSYSSYAARTTVVGDNIKIESNVSSEYDIRVTALNDYYLYKFTTNSNTFDSIGITLVGQNASVNEAMHRRGVYFVTKEPITLPTETWV